MAAGEKDREDGIDFVVIVTPNNTHYEIAKTFLESGINVSCDKPLCVSVEQAKKLQALAKEHDLLFMVTFTYTGYSLVRYLAQYIQDGQIGEIRTIMAEFPQQSQAVPRVAGKKVNWRNDITQNGGTNCLGDIGVHIMALAHMMTVLKTQKVLAQMEMLAPDSQLDDNDYVMVKYDNGASGMYWASKIVLGNGNGLKIRIYGSKGAVTWEQEDAEKAYITDEMGHTRLIKRGEKGMASGYDRLPNGHPEDLYEAMGNLYVSFVKCLKAKQDGSLTPDMVDFPTVDAGVDTLAIVEACLRSVDQGNVWEKLD